MSKRPGSKIKQLSVATGMARKQSCYLSLPKKSTSHGGLQLPSQIKNLSLTFSKSVAQVQLNHHE